MTKQLFEEALADVKKVKQVAEDDAKRAILEAVTPRIRDFIDRAVLNELYDDDTVTVTSGTPSDGEEPTDLVAPTPDARIPIGSAVAVSAPDAEGKVTLDIDALCGVESGTPVAPPQFGVDPMTSGEEYEISLESVDALSPIFGVASALIERKIEKINEKINSFKNAGKAVRSTPAFREQIAQMISRVENMYDYVQEQVSDPVSKRSYETMLEANFKVLNKIQESTTMSQKTNKGQMNEADVTLKLTGLPDDIDLDTVGVDLITGEEDGEGGDDDLGGDDLEGGDDMGDMDLGGDDQMGGQGGQDQMETRSLSDDTIVEIDESMLRREIARMRNLREDHTGTGGSETKAQSWGNAPHGANILDDFGGGDDEGEPLDAEIVDKSPSPGALPLGEADEADEDKEELEEMDETLPEADEPPMAESVLAQRRTAGLQRLGYEKKLQERAKARAALLKKEAARSTGKRLASIKSEYATVAKRFNESVARSQKVTQLVAQATKKLQESRSNSATARPAENQAENATLRKKLAETNLFNAKLLYTNKLLQNDQLSSRQKAQVIKQIDTARTVREAKLVFESLSSTLAGNSRSVNENKDRTVIGSGSRATRPASTQTLNEGHEAERWAKLAGIVK